MPQDSPSVVRNVQKLATCPHCGQEDCPPHSIGRRNAKDLGGVVLFVETSKHYCATCDRIFSLQVSGIDPKRTYTRRVREKALQVFDESKTLTEASRRMLEEFGVHIPQTTLHEWFAEE